MFIVASKVVGDLVTRDSMLVFIHVSQQKWFNLCFSISPLLCVCVTLHMACMLEYLTVGSYGICCCIMHTVIAMVTIQFTVIIACTNTTKMTMTDDR